MAKKEKSQDKTTDVKHPCHYCKEDVSEKSLVDHACPTCLTLLRMLQHVTPEVAARLFAASGLIPTIGFRRKVK